MVTLDREKVRELALEIRDCDVPVTVVAELYRLTEAVLLLTQVVAELRANL
jgi:hypothetical protein